VSHPKLDVDTLIVFHPVVDLIGFNLALACNDAFCLCESDRGCWATVDRDAVMWAVVNSRKKWGRRELGGRIISGFPLRRAKWDYVVANVSNRLASVNRSGTKKLGKYRHIGLFCLFYFRRSVRWSRIRGAESWQRSPKRGASGGWPGRAWQGWTLASACRAPIAHFSANPVTLPLSFSIQRCEFGCRTRTAELSFAPRPVPPIHPGTRIRITLHVRRCNRIPAQRRSACDPSLLDGK
jgi:hypothetical protein